MLTARPGARPVPPPGCLPLEGPTGARGRLCLGPGREAVWPGWPLRHALRHLRGTRMLTMAPEGGPPTGTASPTCRGGNWGAEKPLSPTTARGRAGWLPGVPGAGRGAGLPGTAQSLRDPRFLPSQSPLVKWNRNCLSGVNSKDTAEVAWSQSRPADLGRNGDPVRQARSLLARGTCVPLPLLARPLWPSTRVAGRASPAEGRAPRSHPEVV